MTTLQLWNRKTYSAVMSQPEMPHWVWFRWPLFSWIALTQEFLTWRPRIDCEDLVFMFTCVFFEREFLVSIIFSNKEPLSKLLLLIVPCSLITLLMTKCFHCPTSPALQQSKLPSWIQQLSTGFSFSLEKRVGTNYSDPCTCILILFSLCLDVTQASVLIQESPILGSNQLSHLILH